MRVSAIAAGDAAHGLLTENGNRVGDITVEGTIALILFVGVLFGIVGGLLLFATRTLLGSRFLPLSLGVVLGGLGAANVIEARNPDFTIVGHRPLNVMMFAALFVLYAIVAAWLRDRFDTWLVDTWLARLAPLALVGSLLAAGLGVLALVGALLGDGLARGDHPRNAAALAAVILSLAAAVTPRRAARSVRIAGATLLGVGVAAGWWIAVDEVLTII